MNTLEGLWALEKAGDEIGDVVMSNGTVIYTTTAYQVILAEAQFFVACPGEAQHSRDGLTVQGPRHHRDCGSLGDLHCLISWHLYSEGFSLSVFGPGYIQEVYSLSSPNPLVPVGGFTAENADRFIKPGQSLAYMDSWLVGKNRCRGLVRGFHPTQLQALGEAVKTREELGGE